ncbi:MAG: sortase B protein-sorting domain-containing protein [Methanobacteriaceae archaeon]|nr:sortase B protein-sorting domain-containing protein [Candidatus Methanorudis spinitermitis]
MKSPIFLYIIIFIISSFF